MFLALIGFYASLVFAERPLFEPSNFGSNFNLRSQSSLLDPDGDWMTNNVRVLINKYILKGKINPSFEDREKMNAFISAIDQPMRKLSQFSDMDPSAKDLAFRNGDFPIKIEKQLDALIEALDKADVLDLFVNDRKEIDWQLLRNALCFKTSNASEAEPHPVFESALQKKKFVNQVLESIRKNKLPVFESLSPPRKTSQLNKNKAFADQILEVALMILLQEKIAQAQDHNSPPDFNIFESNRKATPPRLEATKNDLRNALALDFPAEGCNKDFNFDNENNNQNNIFNNNVNNNEEKPKEEFPVAEEEEEGTPKEPGAGTPPGDKGLPSLGSPSMSQGSQGGNLQMVPMPVFPGFGAYTGVAASTNEDIISGAVSGIIASMSQITSGAAAGMAAIEASMQNFQQLMNSIGDKGDQMIPIQTIQNPQVLGAPMFYNNQMGASRLLNRRF